MFYDGFRNIDLFLPYPILVDFAPFGWFFISFPAECNSQPQSTLDPASYQGEPVHQNGGGTGMAFVENARRVWKKHSWVACADKGAKRMHRGTKTYLPKLSSDQVHQLEFMFIHFSLVSTSTSMGRNRPQVQEGGWLSQQLQQQKRWHHIQLFCMMTSCFGMLKGSTWFDNPLADDVASGGSKRRAGYRRFGRRRRRWGGSSASCVETRALCATSC